MKTLSTYFLRAVIALMTIVALAVCIFALPNMWVGVSPDYPLVSYSLRLIMLGLYVAVIPFFLILLQALKLLNYIDRNKAFSEDSVKALKVIKRCAAFASVLFVGGVPLLYPFAEVDDAPGVLLVGAVIACIPVAVAVFAAILQKLFQAAIDIKSENDLTV